jgi:hypothetical protein
MVTIWEQSQDSNTWVELSYQNDYVIDEKAKSWVSKEYTDIHNVTIVLASLIALYLLYCILKWYGYLDNTPTLVVIAVYFLIIMVICSLMRS